MLDLAMVRMLIGAVVVAIIAAVIGWQHWQSQDSATAEGEDHMGQLDADLLKSDIPIDALLDRDFHAYMQKVMNREQE